MGTYNLISFVGIFVLVGFAWLLSADRKNMNWRVIGWGIGLQLLVAVFIFVVPGGSKVFLFVNDVVVKVLDSASAGAKFVFGPLALAPGQTSETGEKSLGFILAFQAFPTIIFFSALIGILYYLGVMPLIVRIVALLIAILGLVALVDLLLSALGAKINPLFGLHVQWSLKTICGYIFYPFTLVLGVPPSDAGVISKIIGERLIVTEVVAYQDLGAALQQHLLHYPRSAVIATYALCGFAHLASMAIFVGGFCALAPEKARNIGPIAFRALLAATLACLLTACVAGTFFKQGSILLGG
jgi:nucleoside permease NupC